MESKKNGSDEPSGRTGMKKQMYRLDLRTRGGGKGNLGRSERVALTYIHYQIYLFIWLHWVFVAACGLSLVVASRGYSFIAVCKLLIAMASLVAEHRL